MTEASNPRADAALRARVFGGAGQQIAGRLWSSACTMGVWMLLGRRLDDAAQGSFVYYFTLFMLAGPLLDFGAYGIAVREIARQPDREREILRFATRFRLGMGALCAGVIATVGLVREPGVGGVLIALTSLHLLSLGAATVGARFHAGLRFLPVALPVVLGATTFLGLVAGFHSLGVTRPEPYLVAYGAGVVLQSLGTFVWGAGHASLFGRVDPDLGRFLWREMAPIGISATVGALYFQLDAVLLRELADPSAVGRYNHAFRLLTFVVLVPIAFCQALLPVMTRLADRSQIVRVLRRASFSLGGVIVPAAALTPFLGDSVLEFVFGSSSDESARCLSLLGFAAVAIYLGYPRVTALTAIGRQGTFTRIAVAIAPVKFVGIWVLFRTVGLEGVALAALLTESLVLILVSVRIRGYLGSFGFGREHGRLVLVAVPVALAAHALRDLEGLPAIVSAVALECGGVLLSGVLPLRLGVERG